MMLQRLQQQQQQQACHRRRVAVAATPTGLLTTARARQQQYLHQPAPAQQLGLNSQSMQEQHPSWLCQSSSAAAGGGGGEEARQPGKVEPVVFTPLEQKLGAACKFLTNLFPLWVVLAALVGYHHPSLFLWFNNTYVTWSLVFCMAAMGLTLTFDEITNVFTRSPQLLLLGMVLQYSVLPSIGWAISRFWGLQASLAIGVALVSCMPGGTASNIVAYIARGDMPLSIMMTTASTMMAVFTTPLLTSILVGTLVPVDPKAMFMSVVQLVLAPVIVGTTLNQFFPRAIQRMRIYTPFLATVAVVMIVGSMISSNVAVVSQSGFTIVTAVLTLHSCGFAIGYFLSKALGLSDKVARTNSIEVGMQSSALAAVLAKIHFPQDPMIVAPCVLSACTHATLGSLLAGYWNLTTKEEEA